MPDSHRPTPQKFLANQGENALSKRLEKILPLTQDFDCLAGHFFIGGCEIGGLKSGESFPSVHQNATRQRSETLKNQQ